MPRIIDAVHSGEVVHVELSEIVEAAVVKGLVKQKLKWEPLREVASRYGEFSASVMGRFLVMMWKQIEIVEMKVRCSGVPGEKDY